MIWASADPFVGINPTSIHARIYHEGRVIRAARQKGEKR